MDFDFGNIIYLIFAVVAAIIGLMGKKKKPAKGAEEGGEGQASRPGFMESLEQVLKMGQEDPMVMDLHDYEGDLAPESSESESVEKESAQGLSLLEEYERLLEKRPEYVSSIKLVEGESGSEPLEVIDLDDEEGTDYFDIVKDFDAGTAVVYSAIINRVDY